MLHTTNNPLLSFSRTSETRHACGTALDDSPVSGIRNSKWAGKKCCFQLVLPSIGTVHEHVLRRGCGGGEDGVAVAAIAATATATAAAAIEKAMPSVTGQLHMISRSASSVLFVCRNREDLAWISATKLDRDYLRLPSVSFRY